MAHDVFISYSSKDKVIADAVCAKLEENKIRVWIAPRDVPAGANFAGSIIDAINSSKVFILIWTANANASEHILNEINQSFEKGITIIPFRIQDIEPTDSMRYYIGRTHWLDAMTPPLEKHIKLLADTILTNLGRHAEIQPEIPVVKEKEVREEKKKEKEEDRKPVSKPSAKPHAWWLYLAGLFGVAVVVGLALTFLKQPAQPSLTQPSLTPLTNFPAGITIAFSLPTNSIGYFNTLGKAAAAEAKAKGVKFVDLTTETEDASAQKQAIDTIITQKPSAIIISIGGLSDPNAFKDTFAKAKAAGIPVLAIEAAIDDPNISALIMTDNLAAAGAEGDYICTALKGAKGTALVIAGTFAHQTGDARQKGVADKLEACGEKVIKKYGMWDDNLVVSIAGDTITANPDLNVIFVANDYGAAVVSALVKQKGLTAKIMVFGFDGEPVMLRAIKDGEGTGTMKQDNVRMGTEIVDTAIKLIIGETIDEKIFIPGIMIDKTNVDQYLTGEATEPKVEYQTQDLGTPDYQTDFSQAAFDAREWPVRNSEGQKLYRGEDDTYIFDIQQPIDVAYALYQGKNKTIENSIVEVEAKFVADANVVGIICRANSEADNDIDSLYLKGYYATFEIDGKTTISKIRAGDSPLFSAEGAKRENGIDYRLRFDCIGQKLTVYENGTKIGEAQDNTYYIGSVGLSAHRYDLPLRVSFDHFKLWLP